MSIFNMKFFRFLGFKEKPKAPWEKYYKKEEMDLKIPNTSLYKYFYNHALKHEDLIAFNYYGTKISYKELINNIDNCAKAFLSQGVRRGDVVSICMPNTPEAVITVLALNKIGVISNMIHPLSSENEIRDTLKETASIMLLVIDIDYKKIKNIINDTDVYKIVLVRANDAMPFFLSIGYEIMSGYKTELPSNDQKYIFWKDFIKLGKHYVKDEYEHIGKKNDPAVMLHSGGSTGNPKAIVLSNGNFMALVEQSKVVFKDLKKKDKCLSIMPIFHGFGLGVCVYTPLCLGAECILIPQFKATDFHKILMKHRPEFVIGVPTLFEALLNNPKANKLKLNHLKYAISGGDNLKGTLENRINDFLYSHGSTVRIIQGYGMSECLAAVSLGFREIPKKDSIGIPFPGAYIGIFNPDDIEVPYGEEGEICISGPNVMLGYYNNEKETNMALHIHKDGNVWLHSGDLGIMDENGFIKYTSRLKRLIVSSGYNVYPAQVEAVLESHEAVLLSSVVGIPHKYKVEVAKAYIVLNREYHPTKELIEELKELCRKNLPKYSLPYEYEFRKSLPRTLVGKVDFRKLQQENNLYRMRHHNEK